MASFVAHHPGSLVEREGRMAAALRSSHRPSDVAEEMAAAAAAGPGAWGGLDRGVGDEFFVEGLLDLEDLCEVDKDVTDLREAAPSPTVDEDKSSDSHGSSGVSYDLMPLPPRDMDLPAHDAEELEWVSRIMDDSLAELPPVPHLSSPSFALRRPAEPTTVPRMVPVPTPTICALSTEALVPVKGKAKRSKRSRGSVWSLSGAAPLSDSTSSCSTTTTSSCSSSASFPPLLLLDSSPFALLEQQQAQRSSKKSKHGKNGGGKPKKRGRKPKHQPRPQFSGAASAPAPGDRRCSHCGVQKTPQWRAGPEGAKTLCNACGVRYKSGRLLPEYRPACSPTFVSTIHSNSHRKVLEMRRKKEGVLVGVPTATAPAVASF
ncbi:hypothetical protein EJB05_52083 [Eragrostis curvula]|uniref:GATA transcription factor n=1 Tax=Eragrostis curvula TaxID=38414 RepID=A0A5J9STX9_9POAL|nr:hypothetical protein EJB05_52083 [Eragrostis curvula]